MERREVISRVDQVCIFDFSQSCFPVFNFFEIRGVGLDVDSDAAPSLSDLGPRGPDCGVEDGGKLKRVSTRSWRRSGVVGAATGVPGVRKEGLLLLLEGEEVVAEEETDALAATEQRGLLRGEVEGCTGAGVEGSRSR